LIFLCALLYVLPLAALSSLPFSFLSLLSSLTQPPHHPPTYTAQKKGKVAVEW